MRRCLVLLFSVLLLLAVFSASAAASRFYTPDYGSSTPEEIGGFDLGPNGSLAPIAGSPFPAAPGPPYEPAGIWGLAFTPQGDRAAAGFLFYGGVQGYSVPAAGVFSLAGPPVQSASVTSIAVSPDGRFAYAPTRDFGGLTAEGIRRFAIGADGTLTALIPSGGSGEYYDIAISPDGRFLFAVRGGGIERFAVAADGSLASLGTTTAPNAFMLAASPDGRFLFVQFMSSPGAVATYSIGADGSLTQAGPPATIAGASSKVFAVAPDGRHLYVPDYNEFEIVTVAIAPDGTPTVVGEMPVSRPESVGVSPDGRFLVYYRTGGAGNTLATAAIGPDGVPVPLPFEVPWDTGEPERIVFQPQPTPAASFKVIPAAPGAASRFDAGASARAARYDWDFGDGSTLADGGPNPTHVYASPGVYTATLTVTDANGCSSRHVYTGQSTLCPGGPAAAAGASVDTLPALGKVKAVPRKFVPKSKGAKAGKAKIGTTFRYTVNEAAKVRFKIERKRIGRLVGKKCKPRTPRNQGRKRCALFKRLGSRSQAAKPGRNKLKWNGNLKGRPLPAGAYRATVIATDRAGGRSGAKTVGFRILPLPEKP